MHPPVLGVSPPTGAKPLQTMAISFFVGVGHPQLEFLGVSGHPRHPQWLRHWLRGTCPSVCLSVSILNVLYLHLSAHWRPVQTRRDATHRGHTPLIRAHRADAAVVAAPVYASQERRRLDSAVNLAENESETMHAAVCVGSSYR